MEHNDIRHKLSEYIDGSLTDRERSDVEVHLKTCAECGNALSELRITIEHIKAVEDIEPPTWMTRKIMANVRAETAAKKGLFERFFLPLSIKLPIQAVAIVFLTVTAFYMYRNIQPASVPSEAPIQEFASGNGPARDRLAKADDRALRAKQVPQAPEYKSLDMKLEYEKSAAPKPMDKAEAPAPAPAKTEGQTMLAKGEAVGGTVAAAPQAIAPTAVKPSEPPFEAKNMAASRAQGFALQAASPAIIRERASKTDSMTKADEAVKDKQEAEFTPTGKHKTSLDFRNFPVVDIYRGKPAPVDLASHPKAPTWRTMLITAVNKGPNFAGRYVIAIWGCGTSCQAFGIIDATTGKVFFPPNLSHVSWAGWWEKDYGLKFQLDSNLLIVYGSPNEEMSKGVFYYLWKDNTLQQIQPGINK